MQDSYIDDTLGTVILNESRRAKSVSIKISHSNNAITLTYPIGYDKNKAVAFLESKRDKILQIKQKQTAQRKNNPPAQSYDEALLRIKAKEYLPRRIAEISAKTNLKYNRVTIRPTRSKWGSCTSQNNISLSHYLITLPTHLIDFVIIHELCHTVHHNHSPKFHALVDYICCGREKEFEKELRGYSIR